MQTQKEVVRLFFYNLAEFVFEYFRDSPAETFARLLQSFFFSTQIGHVRYINILTCSEALGIKS